MLTNITRKSLVADIEIFEKTLLKATLKLKNKRLYHNKLPSETNEIYLMSQYVENIETSKDEYLSDSVIPKIIQKINLI